MIVGIEVGGTFTDLVLVTPNGTVTTHKLPSTPADPSDAAVRGFREVLQIAGVSAEAVTELLHGSTIAANALIQRRGAKTALITTRGFRDVLFIQRQDRTSVYDMTYRKPQALVTRDRVLEISERVGADGEVVTALDEAEAASIADHLRAEGVESVAVCLLHAYANPSHERRLSEILAQRAPAVRQSLSCDIAPEHREYERASTCVIDAFVGPAVERYLDNYGQRVREMGFGATPLIMQSNGGVVPLDRARHLAAGMFVSGPAAAVTAASEIARRSGHHNLISVDVGGTSCDVCLITEGVARTTGKGTAELSVDGLPLNVVMTDIVTIGAGGGSIASVDAGGMLQVGPQSAGADPGPACYGHGGEAFCLTDAMLLLGLLDPDVRLPGDIALDAQRSRDAAAPLAAHFALSAAGLAERVYRIAIANMAQALRRVSVTRGHDPRDFALLPCGGAGPLIAAALADEVGIRTIVLPPNPGIFSAYGLAVADVRMDYVRADGAVGALALGTEGFLERLDSLAAQARAEFTELGYDPDQLVLRFAIDARSKGQGYELRVDVERAAVAAEGPAALVEGFHRLHQIQYGYAARQRPVEVVSFRLTALIERGAPDLAPAPGDGSSAAPTTRQVLTAEGTYPYAVTFRSSLTSGSTSVGPAILFEATTSTPIPAGWRYEMRPDGAIIVEKNQ